MFSFLHMQTKNKSRQTNKDADLLVSHKGNDIAVEVVYSTVLCFHRRNFELAIEKLMIVSKTSYYCLIVLYEVNFDLKSELLKQNIYVYDIRNLLYIFDRTPLREQFLSLIPFAINNIEECEPDDDFIGAKMQNFLRAEHFGTSYYEELANQLDFINRLSSIIPGKADATKYEEYCKDMLKYLFTDNLDRWAIQEHSSENMCIFDLICKIKENASSFWSLINDKFNSRYVIFEFKNYNRKITQKEIYTTEKYLYKTALRNVAIILTRKGIDSNGKKAMAGALREHGKLILTLDDNDIKNILACDSFSASEYLEDKLDEFLIKVSK